MGAQYQVIDNYFSSYLFNSFRDAVFSDSFPWYFNDIRETNQYTHAFLHYNKEGYSSNSPNSAYMDYIYKMGYKLNVDRFFRIKLNANPSTSELLIKLKEPLPKNISTLSTFSINEEITSRIINNVLGINRVLFDFTSKPPGTIEWE